MLPPFRAAAVSAALVAALSLSVAACGDDSESSDGGSSASGPASFDQVLAKAYEGNIGKPPTTGPKAQKGKKVWIISCGQQVISCAAGAKGAEDAAKKIGWDVTVFDGKFNPAQFAAGVTQATSDGADAIILDAVDCATAPGPMKRARDKGIEIVAFYAFDCDDPNVGGRPVFTGQVIIQNSENYRDAVKQWAANSAAWIAARLKGKAKVITFKQDELLVVKYIREGFEEGLAKACPDCEIVETVPITGTDVGPRLQQKTQTAILKHPEANAVYSLYDGLILAGVGAGVRGSGRSKDLVVVGGEGFEPNADLIRGNSGQQTAGNGFPSDWTGYAAVDTTNRLFAGEKPVNSGIGFQVYDKEHNLPKKGPWVPLEGGKPVDYRGAYESIWGVG